jgi:capsular polysaccharide biosynthesis protein
MELAGLLKGLLKRSWLILLIALLAGGGAFWLQRDAKDTYRSSVNVTVPPSQASTSGANGQYVANFTVGLGVDAVVDQVSATTGVGRNTLKSGIKADQIGNSSFITVTYTGTSRAQASAVVVAAATRTSALLAQPAIETATNALSVATTAQTQAAAQEKAASTAVSTYLAKHGGIDPHVRYQALQASITQLSVSKQQAIAQGHATANFDSAITSGQRSLTTLAPQITQYDTLTRTLNQADLAAQTAQARVVAASSDLADAKAAPLVGAAHTTLVTAQETLVRAVAIAVGLGFVLGLGLVLLVELVMASRRQRRTSPSPGVQERERLAARPLDVTETESRPVALR